MGTELLRFCWISMKTCFPLNKQAALVTKKIVFSGIVAAVDRSIILQTISTF